MDGADIDSERPRKRQRCDAPIRPQRARLVLDDTLRAEHTVLSPGLCSLLKSNGFQPSAGGLPHSQHVAIAPLSPLRDTLAECSWILSSAITPHQDEEDDIADSPPELRLPYAAPAAQAFLRTLAAQDLGRHSSHLPRSFDVLVAPATPLALDTVFVTVEKGLLNRVDEVQTRFGGGFQHAKFRKSSQSDGIPSNGGANPLSDEDRITSLVRQGLSSLSIVHTGDVFGLPLPAHPITHVRPAPAIVIESEPVSQGIVSPKTKIVVVYAGSSQEKALKKLSAPVPTIEESLEDTAEDTSNDQFFSAAEDKDITTASELETSELDDDSELDASQTEDSEDESDSMDDMISLTAPGLPPQQAGTLSAMTAATPRPGNYRATGTHTPGSVYSSFTATTARAGSRPGKVFRTEALLRKVPAGLLHPKPAPQDDEDSFVFVDTGTLAKLGCFSGDWARIEVARNVSSFGFGAASLAALNSLDDEDSHFRVVRIYGLSGLLQQKARYTVDKTGDRRSSFSLPSSIMPLSPAIYTSPILLANLSNARFVK
ncbi:peroxisomal assembly protein, partial [Elasticomyces elasticus]